MGRIVVVENVSLDGVMQAPATPEEDTRGGFPYGGWAQELLSADPEAAMASFSGQPGAAMLFGHRTYDGLVGYWLSTTEENPFTAVLRDTPKYVVSRTPGTRLPHPNSHLLDGDPVVDVAKLREETDGEIIVLGSGTLVRTLAAAGLVDSYVLTILPVVLGTGTRLFEGTHTRLEVVRSTTSPTGIVVATYAVVG